MRNIYLTILVVLVYCNAAGQQFIGKPGGVMQVCDSVYYEMYLPYDDAMVSIKTNRDLRFSSSNMELNGLVDLGGGYKLFNFENILDEDTVWFKFASACAMSDTLALITDTIRFEEHSGFLANTYSISPIKFEAFNTGGTVVVSRTQPFVIENRYVLQKGSFDGFALLTQTKVNGLEKVGMEVRINSSNFLGSVRSGENSSLYLDSLYFSDVMSEGDTLVLRSTYNVVCSDNFNHTDFRQVLARFIYSCSDEENCSNSIDVQTVVQLNSKSLITGYVSRSIPDSTCVEIERDFRYVFRNEGNEPTYNVRVSFQQHFSSTYGLIDTSSIVIEIPESSSYVYRNIMKDERINVCTDLVPNPLRMAQTFVFLQDTSRFSNFILDVLMPGDSVVISYKVLRCCTEDIGFEDVFVDAEYEYSSPSFWMKPKNEFTDGGHIITVIYDENLCAPNNTKPLGNFELNEDCKSISWADWGASAGLISINQFENCTRTYMMGRDLQRDNFSIMTTRYMNDLAYVRQDEMVIKTIIKSKQGLRYPADASSLYYYKDLQGNEWYPSSGIALRDEPGGLGDGYYHSAEAIFKKEDMPENFDYASASLFFTMEAYCYSLHSSNPRSLDGQGASSDYLVETYIGYPGCDTCFIPMIRKGCGIVVNCPGCETPGTIISDAGYKIERTTYGLVDNDDNGWPDAEGVKADPSKIRLTNMTIGDTLILDVPIHIYNGGALTIQDLISDGKDPKYMYLLNNFKGGEALRLLETEITLYKDADSTVFSFSGEDNVITKVNYKYGDTIYVNTQPVTDIQTFEVFHNLHLDTLRKYAGWGGQTNDINEYRVKVRSKMYVHKLLRVDYVNCSVSSSAYLRVTPQPENNLFEVPSILEQDLSNYSSVDTLGIQCENFGTLFNIIFPSFEDNSNGNGLLQNNPIRLDVVANIDDCDFNLDVIALLRTKEPLEDNFPFEYRIFGIADSIELQASGGFGWRDTMIVTSIKKQGTAYFTTYKYDTIAIPNFTEGGSYVHFSVADLYGFYSSEPSGATQPFISRADECLYTNFRFAMKPLCGAAEADTARGWIKIKLKDIPTIGDTLFESTIPSVRPPRPELVVNDTARYFPEERRFEIEMLLDNDGDETHEKQNASRHSFFKLDAAQDRIVIDTVLFLIDGNWTKYSYPDGTDSIFKIGVIKAGEIKYFKFEGHYVCDGAGSIENQKDTLRILYGWNCDGYPDNRLNICLFGLDTAYWYMNPRDAGLSMNTRISADGIFSETNTIETCDSVRLRVKINSTSLGKIYGLNTKVKIELPSSLMYRNGSSSILIGNDVVSTDEPTQISDTLIWALDNILDEGYSSVDSSIYVWATFRTVCSFGQAALIKTKVNAQSYCGGDVNVEDTVSVYILPYVPAEKDTLEITVNAQNGTAVFTIVNAGTENTKTDNVLYAFNSSVTLPEIAAGGSAMVSINYTQPDCDVSENYTWQVLNSETSLCLEVTCAPSYVVASGAVTVSGESCLPECIDPANYEVFWGENFGVDTVWVDDDFILSNSTTPHKKILIWGHLVISKRGTQNTLDLRQWEFSIHDGGITLDTVLFKCLGCSFRPACSDELWDGIKVLPASGIYLDRSAGANPKPSIVEGAVFGINNNLSIPVRIVPEYRQFFVARTQFINCEQGISLFFYYKTFNAIGSSGDIDGIINNQFTHENKVYKYRGNNREIKPVSISLSAMDYYNLKVRNNVIDNAHTGVYVSSSYAHVLQNTIRHTQNGIVCLGTISPFLNATPRVWDVTVSGNTIVLPAENHVFSFAEPTGIKERTAIFTNTQSTYLTNNNLSANNQNQTYKGGGVYYRGIELVGNTRYRIEKCTLQVRDDGMRLKNMSVNIGGGMVTGNVLTDHYYNIRFTANNTATTNPVVAVRCNTININTLDFVEGNLKRCIAIDENTILEKLGGCSNLNVLQNKPCGNIFEISSIHNNFTSRQFWRHIYTENGKIFTYHKENNEMPNQNNTALAAGIVNTVSCSNTVSGCTVLGGGQSPNDQHLVAQNMLEDVGQSISATALEAEQMLLTSTTATHQQKNQAVLNISAYYLFRNDLIQLETFMNTLPDNKYKAQFNAVLYGAYMEQNNVSQAEIYRQYIGQHHTDSETQSWVTYTEVEERLGAYHHLPYHAEAIDTMQLEQVLAVSAQLNESACRRLGKEVCVQPNFSRRAAKQLPVYPKLYNTDNDTLNLVPNYSFELLDSNICITTDTTRNSQGELNYNDTGTTHFAGWYYKKYSPDLFNECNQGDSVFYPWGAPENWRGWQRVATGKGYMGILTNSDPQTFEFAGTELTKALDTSKTYYVGFKVVSAEKSSGINNKQGILFTMEPLHDPNNTMSVLNKMHIYSDSIIRDTANWVPIFKKFKPDSAYQYITVGNLFNFINTLYEGTPRTNTNCGFCYYFDDIVVSEDSAYAYKIVHQNIDTTTGTNPGVKEVQGNILRVYPNPFTGEFNLSLNPSPKERDFKLFVYDVLGRMMDVEYRIENDNIVIDGSKLEKGVYILEVSQDAERGVMRTKIVKQ